MSKFSLFSFQSFYCLLVIVLLQIVSPYKVLVVNAKDIKSDTNNGNSTTTNNDISTDPASLQRYLTTHDMESLHKALDKRFHESDRMIDPLKRITPLPIQKVQRGSGLDYTSRYKMKVDLEQIDYLIQMEEKKKKNRNNKKLVQHQQQQHQQQHQQFDESNLILFQKARNVYQKVLDNMPTDKELEPNGGYYRFQSHDIKEGILDYYNRALYRTEDEEENNSNDASFECKSLDVDTTTNTETCSSIKVTTDLDYDTILNPNLDWEDLEKEYWDQDPQVVVIDNILSKEALHKIRKILLESTVFYQTKNPNEIGGYTGAYIDDGLHDRILLELTTQLRKRLPSVLNEHALRYMWAYKYDSTYNGIKLHADMAAVNVNIWITPDEANLDPNSGGLVVFTVKPPADWDIMQYNSDTDKVYEDILKPAGYRNITIPYKENRAVMFDSALFHQTDTFDFKPGYTNRRINLTILYGDMNSIKPSNN